MNAAIVLAIIFHIAEAVVLVGIIPLALIGTQDAEECRMRTLSVSGGSAKNE